MRIAVIQIERDANGERVEFRTPIGEASGYWRGDAPAEFGESSVELEVPDKLRCQSIEIAETESPSLGVDGEAIRMVGTVCDVDRAGVLTIRVGESLVLIETTGVPPAGLVGKAVRVWVPVLELYPDGL